LPQEALLVTALQSRADVWGTIAST
jgi:hypothetical protein